MKNISKFTFLDNPSSNLTDYKLFFACETFGNYSNNVLSVVLVLLACYLNKILIFIEIT